MKLCAVLVLSTLMVACSKKSDDSFKKEYVSTFVEACSKSTGGSEMMTRICTCQASMVVEALKPSETADQEKVRAFILKTAAPKCAQEALQKK